MVFFLASLWTVTSRLPVNTQKKNIEALYELPIFSVLACANLCEMKIAFFIKRVYVLKRTNYNNSLTED